MRVRNSAKIERNLYAFFYSAAKVIKAAKGECWTFLVSLSLSFSFFLFVKLLQALLHEMKKP
jgi:hypothetical protein